MEVEMFSTSMACVRGPKRTESLMNAFSCACSDKFAPPARAKLCNGDSPLSNLSGRNIFTNEFFVGDSSVRMKTN